GFDGHPTATTELGGQLLGRHTAQELLLRRAPPPLGLDRLCRIGLGFLELSDVVVGLGAGEPAAGLALGEPHRTARVPEVAVSSVLDQGEELLQLPR
ncbi:MAG: hypothetical protein M0Z30_08115, partial [Actinomycetota bacterium]|nr:hypothetical protein [Actinomycetota bacterium]